MFKTKKRLKRELEAALDRLRDLQKINDRYFERLQKYEGTPEGCNIGSWCKVCAFRKEVTECSGVYGGLYPSTYTICGKGICKGFKEAVKC